jgi:hypothetical protein
MGCGFQRFQIAIKKGLKKIMHSTNDIFFAFENTYGMNKLEQQHY